jgi:hypothetical protein
MSIVDLLNGRTVPALALIAVVLAAFGGGAISAQDKYSMQVPNGLAFSEFRGYEDWQAVSISQTEDAIAVILANPVMIDAYRSSLSPTARSWRRSIGNRKRARRPPLRRRCRTPCTTSISW